MTFQGPQVEVLERHQRFLEDALSGCDLVELCENLYRSRVISKATQEKVGRLDLTSGGVASCVRFVLGHVRDQVATDSRKMGRFYEVLWTTGGSASKASLSMGCAAGVSAGSGLLAEAHLSMLTEALVRCSYKWEELGIALGLPRHVLEECGEGRSNEIRLYNVLSRWISANAGSASLAQLRQAVAGPLVSQPNLLAYLEPLGLDHLDPLGMQLGGSSGAELQLDLVFQSSEVKVKDGCSTFLEVKVAASGPVQYQWKKDGQPLLEKTADVSGTTSSILYIQSVGVACQGQYSCMATSDNKQVESD